ncbi:MAG: phosphocholine cytidylyltransferase family protein [Actinomycetota bacterium]|nr:phosphocholine cytidylyltransferase family protein [Actinomycetota bacterium]
MIGVVLAAGAGRRLLPLTAALPKTLLPVAEDLTILDIALANLRAVGIDDVAIVTGFAADRVRALRPTLQRRHGVRLELVYNERAEEWNNAYSLWLARDALAEGALLVNGDTVHPVSIEEGLLEHRGRGVVLAVDREKPLGSEEMKVSLSEDGALRRIGKEIASTEAQGEYMGVTLIDPGAAAPLADALEATWRRDPSLYYEDGYQELADRGGRVAAADIGTVRWIEVDDHRDLARARELMACPS